MWEDQPSSSPNHLLSHRREEAHRQEALLLLLWVFPTFSHTATELIFFLDCTIHIGLYVLWTQVRSYMIQVPAESHS